MSTQPLAKVETAVIQANLATLRERAEQIVVRNQEDYVSACQVALDARSYIKDVGFKLDPGIQSARDHLEFLRNEKAKYVGPAEQILELASRKAAEWKRQEREATQREQDKINEAARKEARDKHAKIPAPVQVVPAVPKVAGIRARVNWYWRMKQIDLVPRQFLYPYPNDAGQFDSEKFPRIGKLVRETKDKANAEAAIPGIEVWSEDAV